MSEYKNSITSRLNLILTNKAVSSAEKNGHKYILPKDVILSILVEGEGLACVIINEYEVSIGDLRKDILNIKISEEMIGKVKNIQKHKKTSEMLLIADKMTSQLEHKKIGTEHVILAVLSYEGNDVELKQIKNIFNKYGIERDSFAAGILGAYTETPLQSVGEMKNGSFADKKVSKDGSSKMEQQFKAADFIIDLNEIMSSSEDKIIGRNSEIDRCVQILCRKKKNNVIVIGESGVGKTELINGIAKRIVEGKIPDKLKLSTIYSFNVGNVVAGTKYRGQFEERMKNIIKFLKIKKKSGIEPILFIDEIQSIISAGNSEGALDAASILKPELSSGEIQCIGTITSEDHKKYFRKDAALSRRFSTVFLNEPSDKDTIDILMGIKDEYEKFHKIKIDKDIVKEIVRLCGIYIKDRFNPDKSIDVLDEAASRLSINFQNFSEEYYDIDKQILEINNKIRVLSKEQKFEECGNLKNDREYLKKRKLAAIKKHRAKFKFDANSKMRPNLDFDHILDVISEWSGVPITNMTMSEKKKMLNMENAINSTVIGQENVVKEICSVIKKSRVGLKDKNRPIGVFILIGPTGTGKTHIAKKISEYMFDTERIIRLDMSEYMEKHSVSQLIGCFVPGTKITTIGGRIKNIEDISEKEMVLTHNGRFMPVEKIFSYQYDGEIINIRAANSNVDLSMTPKHEVFAIKASHIKRGYKNICNKENANWFMAKDLEVGDIVVFPRINNTVLSPMSIDLWEYVKNLPKYKCDEKHVWCYKNKKINRYIDIDEDFVRLAGYYVSEGGSDKKDKNINFSFNVSERQYIEEVKSLICKIFTNEASFTTEKDVYKNKERIYFSSRAVSILFKDMFGKNVWSKKLPNFFLGLDSNLLNNFIETAIFGDGSTSVPRRIQYDTVSEQLYWQINCCLSKLGYITHNQNRYPDHVDKRGLNNKKRYRIYISGNQIVKLSKNMKNLDIKLLDLGETNIQRLSHVDDEYIYFRLKNVSRSNYNGIVHDLSVKEDVSYCANGIAVHNSPPGYVGHDDGGQLAEMIRKHPYSVVLLDEFEKSHKDVSNVFLQVFDEGRLTDSKGKTVDFSNTIILMTSNLAASKINKNGNIGFVQKTISEDNEKIEKFLKSEVKKYFPPEFINRIDGVLVFNKLTKDDISKIFDIEFNKIIARASDNNISIKISKKAKDIIIDNGYSEEFGARPMKRAIEKMIETPLSEAVLECNQDLDDVYFYIDVVDDKEIKIVEKPRSKKATTTIDG